MFSSGLKVSSVAFLAMLAAYSQLVSGSVCRSSVGQTGIGVRSTTIAITLRIPELFHNATR